MRKDRWMVRALLICFLKNKVEVICSFASFA